MSKSRLLLGLFFLSSASFAPLASATSVYAFCDSNPKTCAASQGDSWERREKLQNLIAYCDRYPGRCESRKEDFRNGQQERGRYVDYRNNERDVRRDDIREFCKDNPKTCAANQGGSSDRQEARIAKLIIYCDLNPRDCEKAKEEFREGRDDRRQTVREFCDDNPQTCAAGRGESPARREQQIASLMAYCDRNPRDCERAKEEYRER